MYEDSMHEVGGELPVTSTDDQGHNRVRVNNPPIVNPIIAFNALDDQWLSLIDRF